MADSVDDKSKGILWFFGSLLLTAATVLIVLGGWWGIEPNVFNVNEEAVIRMESTNSDAMPIGFVYTNTLAHMAEVLMEKPGGYISNDVAPPGLFLDNIRSWEYGALVMLRDGTTALRNHFSRDQSQSIEDKDLSLAEPYFYYEPNSWALPSTESEYDKGVKYLHRYMQRLQNPSENQRRSQFYSRADNLWTYLEVVIKRLGSLSTRLTASSDRFAGAAGILYDPSGQVAPTNMEEKTKGVGKTPWLLIDNIFYEARGESWALLHILQAIKIDFGDIILDKRAMNTLDNMIHALENSLTPILSPMILSGNGFGMFANYSLSMANYIARANAAALDLRDLMNKG
ncbi:MAG: DUF2333 family protein [Methylococcales symbiont of Hymedesmia sp. n. MRB-2018]|nr:MAG: DUF2333 family protein [Methylococcales symbiont of Hymedesmia sp. n. MRB-2018]KAF3984419.1 MAG: DUF2333 family protein [Methylococcales symbiont of Hymedesmia sp. n. MRB-2018]